MAEKVVLIGAGSAMFTRGLVADLILRGEACELALVDIDPDALAVAEGLSRKMIEAKGAPVKLSASTNRRDVLKGATVVICTIGVGGRRAWEQDVFVPRKHGIYQPVGDSVMPGGTSRALRMIPAMVDIAKDVMDLAPDALFFNYGNPMSAVCRGVRKATGANMIGLCHGVHHVAHYIADALGVSRSQITYSAVGINHLTWFTEVRVDARDAMPDLREVAKRRLSAGISVDKLGVHFEEAGTAVRGEVVNEDNPFSWQLFLMTGAFPAVLDRHITEFFPHMFTGGSYYGKQLGVDAYSFEETIKWGDSLYQEMQGDAFSKEPLNNDYFERISGEHEQVLEIVDSIRCDARKVYSANLPNRGQVPNLPWDAVIECPVVADGSGLRPLMQPALPSACAGALATRFAWVETTAEAALEGSREKFIQALILDGSVDSLEMAAKLADDLLNTQKDYLPQFNLV